jgi:hypothetical protein
MMIRLFLYSVRIPTRREIRTWYEQKTSQKLPHWVEEKNLEKKKESERVYYRPPTTSLPPRPPPEPQPPSRIYPPMPVHTPRPPPKKYPQTARIPLSKFSASPFYGSSSSDSGYSSMHTSFSQTGSMLSSASPPSPPLGFRRKESDFPAGA